MTLIRFVSLIFVAALCFSTVLIVDLAKKVKLERSTPRPAALIKQHDKVYHGCIIYTINGGVRIRVEDGKQMILMGELSAEDDPDYYCTNDQKGPHPR